MTKWFLDERGQALENAFIRNREKEIYKKLQSQQQSMESKEALKKVSGINDDQILAHAMEAGITAETFGALILVPMIEVAWANRKMEAGEKLAILQAAKSEHLSEESPAYHLLSGWLESKPGPQLFQAWQEYVKALGETLGQEKHRRLRDEILARTREVAKKSGGLLGVGAVSPEEEKIIDLVAKAFD